MPLIGSLIGYIGRSVSKYFSEIITCLFVSISAILSVIVFFGMVFKMVFMEIIKFLNGYLLVGFTANWSINIDPLSSVMLVVVTFVSALVHIYSIGYMSHDPT